MAEVIDLDQAAASLAFAADFVAGRFKDVRNEPGGGWSALCPLCDGDTRINITRTLIVETCANGHTTEQIVDASRPREDTLSVGVADFFATCKDTIEWLLEPYVCKGGFTLVQGAPKCGKTWLVAWIAACVAERGQKVLFVEEEGAAEVLRDRLKPFVGNGAAHNKNLLVAFRKRIKLDLTKSVDALIAEVRRTGAALVVLDPFIALHSKREKESDEMAIVLDSIRQLVTETGCAVLLVHHTRKGDSWSKSSTQEASSEDARGSGSIIGDVDHVIAVRALPASRRTEGEVSFYVENPDTRLKAPFTKKLMSFRLSDGSMQENEAEKAQESVEELLARMVQILPAEPQYLNQHHVREALRVAMARVREAVYLGIDKKLLVSVHNKGLARTCPA